jgi:hypothetical protein
LTGILLGFVSRTLLDDGYRHLDRHYLGDRAGLAENALRRLEKKNRTKTVQQLKKTRRLFFAEFDLSD